MRIHARNAEDQNLCTYNVAKIERKMEELNMLRIKKVEKDLRRSRMDGVELKLFFSLKIKCPNFLYKMWLPEKATLRNPKFIVYRLQQYISCISWL